MKTLKDAIGIILAEPPEMHYPAYFANLLSQADVPDIHVGKCSESRTARRRFIGKRRLMRSVISLNARRQAIRAMDAVKQLPSAQPAWIPCSERMPEDYTEVLVWFEYFRYGNYNRLYQAYGIGDYSSEYDSWVVNGDTGWRDLKVYAWMPMPAPWREETDDQEI